MDWDELIATYPYMAFHGWDGKPVTMAEWLEIEKRGRHVGDTYVRHGGTTIRVSTVLLGTDMAFGSYEKPLIFETMTFTDNGDTFTNGRYFTLAQARRGHKATLKTIRRLSFHRPQLIHKGRKP